MSQAHADTARGRLVADIDRMRRGGATPPVAELSDRAALLVACGLTSPTVRSAVVRRLHADLPMPTVGGFAQLRLLQEQRHVARQVLAREPGSMLRLAVRTRLAELDRRHGTLRGVFVRGAGVFATRGKDIRTARRAGVHLDTAERAQLFDALGSTPTLLPVPVVPRTMLELGGVAAARGRREAARMPVPPRVRTVVDALPDLPVWGSVPRNALPEMYTAMIMEAGALYDRLTAAYRRGGRVLDEVRLQFDAEHELVDIAGDLCRIRETAIEAGVLPTAREFTERTGMGAQMDAVWAEVVDRVVALRELVETVEERVRRHLAESERLRRTAGEFGIHPHPDGRVDDPVDRVAERLVGGSGNRELSTETMRRLRGQLDPGD